MHYEQVQVIYKGYQTVLFNLITDFFRPFLLFPLSTPFFELEHHGNFAVLMKNIIRGHFKSFRLAPRYDGFKVKENLSIWEPAL